jgi:hypothetical protein
MKTQPKIKTPRALRTSRLAPDFRSRGENLIKEENLQFRVANGNQQPSPRDETIDGPLPTLFSILKIYPVFDPCKSWGA